MRAEQPLDRAEERFRYVPLPVQSVIKAVPQLSAVLTAPAASPHGRDAPDPLVSQPAVQRGAVEVLVHEDEINFPAMGDEVRHIALLPSRLGADAPGEELPLLHGNERNTLHWPPDAPFPIDAMEVVLAGTRAGECRTVNRGDGYGIASARPRERLPHPEWPFSNRLSPCALVKPNAIVLPHELRRPAPGTAVGRIDQLCENELPERVLLWPEAIQESREPRPSHQTLNFFIQSLFVCHGGVTFHQPLLPTPWAEGIIMICPRASYWAP